MDWKLTVRLVFDRFKEHKDAMVAIEKMNNFPLAGREVSSRLLALVWLSDKVIADSLFHRPFTQIKVGLVADRSTTFNKHLTTAQEPNLQLEEQGELFPLSPISRIGSVRLTIVRNDRRKPRGYLSLRAHAETRRCRQGTRTTSSAYVSFFSTPSANPP